jgi:hypothetical protein
MDDGTRAGVKLMVWRNEFTWTSTLVIHTLSFLRLEDGEASDSAVWVTF